jgi:riboflavin synthase
MFTGIIEELGAVARIESMPAGARLRVRCRRVLEDIQEGASISVNGACLTVATFDAGAFSADVSPETYERSNLSDLRTGSMANLERSLAPTSRLGGHLVQGHVDATGEFLGMEPLGSDNWSLRVRIPAELERYVVVKGSITFDGVSLTVAALEGSEVSVAVIPVTYRQTALRLRRPGERVNVECDILAKYVEKLLAAREEAAPSLTVEKMRSLGY